MHSKRGAKGWEDDDEEIKGKWRRNSRDDWGAPEDRHAKKEQAERAQEDWDIEATVERRIVQVIFAVPKQRSCVVNANVDGRSLISLDDGVRRARPCGM